MRHDLRPCQNASEAQHYDFEAGNFLVGLVRQGNPQCPPPCSTDTYDAMASQFHRNSMILFVSNQPQIESSN